MNDTLITLRGWLGNEVDLRRVGDVPVASFRMAATPRRFQRSTGEWVDGETQWYTVNVWRALADNCARSLRRGDPVVVHGRLSLSTWVSQDGVEMSGFEIDATFVGHDLSRGTTSFTKTVARQQPEGQHHPVGHGATVADGVQAGEAPFVAA